MPQKHLIYHKVQIGHPSYERVKACQERGLWICDAVTHNSREGCSNPDCFNYVKRRKR